MNKEKSSFFVAFGAVLGLIPIGAGLFFENLDPISSILFLVSMVLLGLSYDSLGEKTMLSQVLFSLAILFYALTCLLRSPLGETLPKALVSLYPLAFTLLLGKPFHERKVLPAVLSLLVLLMVFFSMDSFTGRYLFFNAIEVDYARVQLLLEALLGCLLLILVLFVLTRDKDSLLVTILGFVALFLSLFLDRTMAPPRDLPGFVPSSASLTILFSLILYIRSGKASSRKEERRMVTFSNMVYEELKPLKRKPRPRKFEIPPNVPKRRSEIVAETEENQSEK